ncbi:hypothetical protein AAVH_17189 [Aphelenchoides avenae]|nr:hypothetical protein AAVH_17189 [Aphelenchus avenae]
MYYEMMTRHDVDMKIKRFQAMEFYAFSGHHRNKEPCDTCPGGPRMRLMYTEEVKNFFFWTCPPCPDVEVDHVARTSEGSSVHSIRGGE